MLYYHVALNLCYNKPILKSNCEFLLILANSYEICQLGCWIVWVLELGAARQV
jgi:hypothetical protein